MGDYTTGRNSASSSSAAADFSNPPMVMGDSTTGRNSAASSSASVVMGDSTTGRNSAASSSASTHFLNHLVDTRDSMMADLAAGKDLFKKLPDQVVAKVLSLLDFRKAVRTSVLSKKWRYMWISMPILRLGPVLGVRNSDVMSLDATEVLNIMHYNPPMPSRWGDTVEHILGYILKYQGQVLQCAIKWPPQFMQPELIDRFISMMMCAGLTVLEISPPSGSKFSYMIPRRLFSSETLKILDIKLCRLPLLSPSAAPGGLTVLKLWRLPFSDDGEDVMKSIFMVCKNLQCIEVRSCSGLRMLKINLTSLTSVHISSLWPICVSLEDSLKVKEVSLVLGKHDLRHVVSNWTKVSLAHITYRDLETRAFIGLRYTLELVECTRDTEISKA